MAMGFCSNLKDIFKPPLLVFLLTITGLAATLFVFSISMKLNREKILNPDIQSWNHFYRSISALGVCLLPKSSSKLKGKQAESHFDFYTEEALTPDSEISNMTRISFLTDVKLTIDGTNQKNFYVQCLIRAQDLGYPRSDDKVALTVSLPKIKKRKLACLSLLGPSYLLPDAQVLLPRCSPPKKPSNDNLLFMPLEDAKDREFCPSGHHGSMIFEENEHLNVYLTEMDTTLIQLHIFATSVVLCLMVVAFFVYSVCGKLFRNEKKYQNDPDLVPLDL